MTISLRSAKYAALFTLTLILAFSAALVSKAQDAVPTKAIVVSDLAGTWVATASGVTGCGVTTLTSVFKLDATGNGTQIKATEHTVGCGDLNLAGLAAQIQALNANGSGFIGLVCGTNCGFGFNIQVAPSKTIFNMGPQAVPGNFLAGVAVKR